MLPVGIITDLISGDVFNWGKIMAGALLAAAPPLVIYAFLMDYYIAGPDRRRDKGLITASDRETTMAEVSLRKVVKRYDGGVRR